MEDEIHQVCPIVWWHVWDNYPYPEYNDVIYQATDLLNCHSHMTYEMIKDRHPDKTNFIPHAVPKELYFEFDDAEKRNMKHEVLGPENADHFIGIWINRNAKRKRPGDLLLGWSKFMKRLEKEEGHKKATLLMHTDPHDQEGPNLFGMLEALDIQESVVFSTDRLEFEKINVLYNISDFCINVSLAEGFGLGTLEAMMTGTPIIASKTGGMTRQVVDHRDGSENGIALPIELQSLVGSQGVPYIYEDYVSSDTICDAIFDLYKMGPEKRSQLGQKAKDYANHEFKLQDTIDAWDSTMKSCLKQFHSKEHKSWHCVTI